jgi:hypothetical protein
MEAVKEVKLRRGDRAFAVIKASDVMVDKERRPLGAGAGAQQG